jgi:hypothetical protein
MAAMIATPNRPRPPAPRVRLSKEVSCVIRNLPLTPRRSGAKLSAGRFYNALLFSTAQRLLALERCYANVEMIL